MKRFLLDTHIFLWWLTNDSKIPKEVAEEIANPVNEVYVSAASCWEISIKKTLGKLQTPDYIAGIVEEKGFLPLPIGLFHSDQVGQLPFINQHKDPFDRMLIAQAQAEGLTIITHDEQFASYGIRILKI